MKKKLIFFTAFLMLLVFISFASATNFDNIKSYNESTKTITVTNNFGIGENIATMKLLTPLDHKVPFGAEVKVFEFEIENLGDTDLKDLFTKWDFYNVKDGLKEIWKDIDLKYKVIGYENITDYNCTSFYNDSLTNDTRCNETEIIGYHLKEVENYYKITPATIKKGQKMIISGWAYVEEGDKIEWVFEALGVRVDEWAVWTADLNVNIRGYWTLNETSGGLIDSVNGNGASSFGANLGTVGLINYSVNFDDNTDRLEIVDVNDLDVTEISLSLWVNPDSVGVDKFIQKGTNYIFYTDSSGYLYFYGDLGGGAVPLAVYSSTIITTGSYQHIVATYDGTTGKLYHNGVSLVNNTPAGGDLSTNSDTFFFGNNPSASQGFNGDMDEVGLWNRSLTQSEVIQLYNEGNGITYTTDFDDQLVINLTSPTNTTYTTTSINVNWTNSSGYNETYKSLNGGSNSSLSQNDSITGSQGFNNLTIYARDNATNLWSSDLEYFTVDSLGPTITINSPENGQTYTEINITTNITTSDATGVDDVIFNHNGTNYTYTGVEVLNYTNGANTLMVWANDTLGNWGYATSSFTVSDFSPPEVTLYTPLNDSYTDDNNIEFIAFVSSELPLINVSLKLDGVINETNTSIINNTNYTFNKIFPDGSYNWTVEAWNNESLVSITETYDFVIDAVPPTVNATSNSSIIYQYPSFYNVTLNITSENPDSCYWTSWGWPCPTTCVGPGPFAQKSYFFDCSDDSILVNISDEAKAGLITVTIIDLLSRSYQDNLTFINDTTAPTINITYPVGSFDYILEGNLTTDYLNWTVNDTNLEDCWYSYNNSNNTVTCLDNSTLFNVTGEQQNLTFWANDSLGNIAYDFQDWVFKVTEVNYTFNDPSISGSVEDIDAWVIIGSGFSLSSANLIYNGTSYSANLVNYPTYSLIRASEFVIPSVSVETNYTFYFSLTLDDDSVINLSSQNQTVSPLLIDNCSTYNNTLYNFTLVDEEEQTNLIGDIEANLVLYSNDRSTQLLSRNIQANNTVYAGICSNEEITEGVSYSADVIIKYSADDYAIEYYNIVNDTIDSDTNESITLYDLKSNDTTDFRITFKDSNYIVSPDTLIYVNRQYIPENNTFKTVELPITDSNGQTILHLVRNDIIYNLVAVKDGETVGELNNIVAFCEDIITENCNIEFRATDENIIGYEFYEDIGVNTGGIKYNPTTEIYNFSYTSRDGTPKEVNLTVYRVSSFGNRSLCSSQVSSSASAIFCDISGSNTDNSSLIARVFIDGVESINTVTKQQNEGYGGIGYLASFIMVLAMVLMFGSTNMEGQLLGLLAGFVASFTFGLIQGGLIGWGAVGIYLIVAVGIMFYKLNKGKSPNG